ncbi:MAG: MFS transporter [Deltaproteobacteria bacterium]|nr:MAG: MFS transporter [Deltaproteobacteria bacterium]
MTETTRLKWLFACLYFVQGGTISYFSIFQKPYLNQIGIERSTIGLLTSILLLPFILKVGFGWMSDKFPHKRWGHRKPYMFIGLLIAFICFSLCSLFPADKTFSLYIILVVTASFSIAMFDAATDGMAVDRIPEQEQGSVQSYMVAGKAIGVITLSLGIGRIAENIGYKFVFLAIGFIYILPLILTYKIKNPEQNESLVGEETDTTPYDKMIFILCGLFAITYSIVSFGTDGLVSLYLSDKFGLSEIQIGSYGSARGIGAILGASICGYAISKGKDTLSFYLGLIFIALGTLIIGFLIDESNYLIIGNIWGSVWGFQEVCFLTLAMRVVSHGASAFGFAALMALGNLGTALSEAILTGMTKNLGYTSVFIGVALFIVIPLLLLCFLQRRLNQVT